MDWLDPHLKDDLRRNHHIKEIIKQIQKNQNKKKNNRFKGELNNE